MTTSDQKILINIGTTNIKKAVVKASEIIEYKIIKELETDHADLIINVDSEYHIPESLQPDHQRIIERACLEGIYDEFGEDRLINALGAVSKYTEQPLLILDYGTYTTVTGLDYQSGEYILSLNLIEPGLDHLRDFKKSFPALESKNAQEDSITLSVKAKIEYFQKYYPRYKIIVTGGWSEFVAETCPDIEVDGSLWVIGCLEYLSY